MSKETKCECGAKVPLIVGRHECSNGCGRSFRVTQVAGEPVFLVVCYGRRSVAPEQQPDAVGALKAGSR